MSAQSIKAKLQEEVKVAMKAKQKERLAVLRLILADIKRIEVDERITLDMQRELALLDKMQKQRKDSISQFKAANRDDLIAQEEFELSVIQEFMPKQLSEAEVADIIKAAISESQANSVKDMGKVMALIKPKLQGRADMGKASGTIKALLAASGNDPA